MKTPKQNPIELLKRAAKLKMTYGDYHKLRILFAKNHDARIYSSLESSLASRELRQSFNTLPFDAPEQMQRDIA